MGRFRGVELDEVELHGERLILRRWHPSDAGDVQAIMSDGSMRRFLARPDPYTLDAATTFVTETGHEGRTTGEGLGCAVIERASGRLVGAAALRLSEDPNIGYWVAPTAQGQGYASEATRMLLDWGFDLGLHRVRLDCDVTNLASVRTAMAAGFSFEGVARGAGAEVDSPDSGLAAAHLRQPDHTRGSRVDIACFARLSSDTGEPVPTRLAALPTGGLTDGVLTLRGVLPEDALGLFETEDDTATQWGFTGRAPTAREIQLLAARAGLDWLVGGMARMAIVDVASGGFAGMVTLRPVGPPAIFGIGYGVHPDFRGRSYTSRALRLLTAWAFEQAGLTRLELGAKRGNLASQRAALTAGFDPDGEHTARLRNPDGTFSDEITFALVNPLRR